jgi:hypothetical protein
MTTSSFQRSAFQAYLTVSGMADEASDYAASLKPGTSEWDNAYSRAFALRDAAIKILEVNCDAE